MSDDSSNLLCMLGFCFCLDVFETLGRYKQSGGHRTFVRR